jgi:hypothetical protein
LEDNLWQTALETAGQMDISPACEESLRAWITVSTNLTPETTLTTKFRAIEPAPVLLGFHGEFKDHDKGSDS